MLDEEGNVKNNKFVGLTKEQLKEMVDKSFPPNDEHDEMLCLLRRENSQKRVEFSIDVGKRWLPLSGQVLNKVRARD